jgi:hypothetical protein
MYQQEYFLGYMTKKVHAKVMQIDAECIAQRALFLGDKHRQQFRLTNGAKPM